MFTPTKRITARFLCEILEGPLNRVNVPVDLNQTSFNANSRDSSDIAAMLARGYYTGPSNTAPTLHLVPSFSKPHF